MQSICYKRGVLGLTALRTTALAVLAPGYLSDFPSYHTPNSQPPIHCCSSDSTGTVLFQRFATLLSSVWNAYPPA